MLADAMTEKKLVNIGVRTIAFIAFELLAQHVWGRGGAS